MYLSLFSNPIQSIARIALTHIVSHLSLPTLTISLFTTVTRLSINTIGIVPTLNTLFLLRRFITSNNVLSVRSVQSLLQSSGALINNSVIESIVPFLSILSNTRVFKLLNLFIISIIFTCIKHLVFKTVKLLFTGFTLLTSSIFYWELPVYITELLPKVPTTNDEFIEKLTQYLFLVGSILLIFQVADYDTVMSISTGALNITTYPLRICYRVGCSMYNWFFPPTIL